MALREAKQCLRQGEARCTAPSPPPGGGGAEKSSEIPPDTPFLRYYLESHCIIIVFQHVVVSSSSSWTGTCGRCGAVTTAPACENKTTYRRVEILSKTTILDFAGFGQFV